MKKKIVYIILIALVLTSYFFLSNGAFVTETRKTLTVENGMSNTQIIDLLYENGIIKNKLVFRTVNKLTNKEFFKSGTAEFSSKMSYGDIIDTLVNKMDSSVRVTIPEGYELCQIAELFEKELGIPQEAFYSEVENGKFDYPFIKDLPAGKFRLEGFLFPDTYMFEKNGTTHDAIDICLKRFSEVYTDELEKKAEKLGFTTNEIITLASIIEKETSAEHGLVSSVFHNRLKSTEFRRLQSCATVIYVTKQPKDRLNALDIQVDSPYNTYINDGLPPGPICSPGRVAIEAAVNPEKSDYYYFSADGNGRNSFSKTYEEHLEKNRG